MLSPVRTILARFGADEAGGPAIEYMLLATLIAMTILVGFTVMTDNVRSTYDTIRDSMP